jgi:hypothetical protein
MARKTVKKNKEPALTLSIAPLLMLILFVFFSYIIVSVVVLGSSV